ncbi:MAG: DUF4062 domain-containing protein [Oscillospiraceae bacterium]|nr:DUF4062 domain-containing protein [Oscillospiraceae bacterium]
MKQKYQVFISSTYKNLKDERKLLTQTLLRKDCYPVGMEWFPAIDEKQFEYIKRVIDASDYYVIILGGLYGSTSPDGKSYTEKEYDYAVEKGKCVIALVQKNPTQREENDDLVAKYSLFHKKVISNRLVSFWDTTEELSSILSTSLDKTISLYPKQGWIRCEKETCDRRLPMIEINTIASHIEIDTVNTIHIMASGSSSYIPIVKSILKLNKNNQKYVHIYIYFRLGSDVERISYFKKQYNLWWNQLKNEYKRIRFHFIGEKDYKVSFRGIVVNQEVGLIGFYVRVNNATTGTLEDCIFVDKTTDCGNYLISSFMKCFEIQKDYPTLKDCVDALL